MRHGHGEKVRSTARTPAGRPARAQPHPQTVVSPLPSKLGPPRTHVGLVPRRTLLDALRRCDAPLVLLSAAAGSGKTTALLQWTAGESRPVAWLRLDAADNDPVLLLVYLAAALGDVASLDPSLGEMLDVAVPPVW